MGGRIKSRFCEKNRKPHLKIDGGGGSKGPDFWSTHLGLKSDGFFGVFETALGPRFGCKKVRGAKKFTPYIPFTCTYPGIYVAAEARFWHITSSARWRASAGWYPTEARHKPNMSFGGWRASSGYFVQAPTAIFRGVLRIHSATYH